MFVIFGEPTAMRCKNTPVGVPISLQLHVRSQEFLQGFSLNLALSSFTNNLHYRIELPFPLPSAQLSFDIK
jgi:hypothetical protein